jgi:glutathione S-transferase
MPAIPTRRDDIRALTGVHLFHFAMSNCSQRVRLALTEKGVAWTSHHVDLARNEHLAPEFQALNPKGVVPVLVHDGKTITESNDIITYVDETFAGPRLMPEADADKAFALQAIRSTDAIQPALKLVTHEFLFKPVRRMNPRQLADIASRSGNAALVQFMRDFSSKEGFGRARIAAAVGEFAQAFGALEERLAQQPWLSGPAFGIADISWIVNVHRITATRYPLSRHPRLSAWYRRMRERPSFEAAIDRFEQRSALFFFALYTRLRAVRGTAITHYL